MPRWPESPVHRSTNSTGDVTSSRAATLFPFFSEEKLQADEKKLSCEAGKVSSLLKTTLCNLRATAHAADPKDHVCSEYLFSKCQNVGRFFHEVSLASLYHLNSTTSLPMRYSGSKRIASWQWMRNSKTPPKSELRRGKKWSFAGVRSGTAPLEPLKEKKRAPVRSHKRTTAAAWQWIRNS